MGEFDSGAFIGMTDFQGEVRCFSLNCLCLECIHG